MEAMPLQNRVNPLGNIVASPSRGTLMGNRGCLHDDTQTVRKAFARKAWVTCRLNWKGIQREVFSSGRYSELFFLDEATALAAGHRPCNDCRGDAYSAFKTAWQATQATGGFVKAEAMDNQIHIERYDAKIGKRTFSARLGDLPDGVMVVLSQTPQQPYLLWRGNLRQWSFEGYGATVAAQPNLAVEVLTPASICAVLASGYQVDVHATVSSL
jgi:hypothetical protein